MSLIMGVRTEVEMARRKGGLAKLLCVNTCAAASSAFPSLVMGGAIHTVHEDHPAIETFVKDPLARHYLSDSLRRIPVI